nr:uncharacterized protein LOC124212256 [Neodiprion pinetum]
MDFQCFLCYQSFATIPEMTRHLRIDHALLPGFKLILKCCCPPCSILFQTYSGLRKHLLKHKQESVTANECGIQSNVVDNPESDLEFQIHNNPSDSSADHSFTNLEDMQIFLDDSSSSSSSDHKDEIHLPTQNNPLATNYLLKLDATGIPKSSLQSVIESSKELVNNVIDNVLNFLDSTDLGHSEPFRQYLGDQKKLFNGIDTNYKIGKYYSRLDDFVKPVELSIGTRFDQIFDSSTNTYKTVAIPCTFMYVPILDNLRFILANPSARKIIFHKSKQITRNGNKQKNNTLQDINDGSYFASHPLFAHSNYALQLQIYYDDFETTNPLGSKTGVHKLGGIYFTLRNFPPYVNSSLENIHLLALFHAADYKTFGFDEILEPIIKDIKILESEGLDLGKKKVKDCVPLLKNKLELWSPRMNTY